MGVRCDLCGGENEIHPGQEMLRCCYCGSSLAIALDGGPEHLILPHERDDGKAEKALVSLLKRKGLRRPGEVAVEFAYVPYVLVPGQRGRTLTVPAPGAPPWAPQLPFPPAGNYSFFDPGLAGEGRLFEAGTLPGEAERLLHLPLYKMTYRASGRNYRATVTGESLLVQGREFPPPGGAGLNVPNLLVASSLFVAFLFAGEVGSGWAARALVIFAAAALGYAALWLRRRLGDDG